MEILQRLHTIKKSEGFQQTVLNIVGNLVTTALSALAVILITRILGPKNFGEFSVGFSLVLIITRLNDFGLNTAITKFASAAQNNSEKKYIYTVTLKYKKIISFLFVVLGLLFYNKIAGYFNLQNPLIILFALTFGICTVYFEHLLVTLQSLHLFSKAVLINALQTGSKLIGTLVLMLFHVVNPAYYFLIYIASPFIPTFFTKKLLPQSIQDEKVRKSSELERKILALARHSSVALISAGIIENIDVLFLQKNLTSYEAGLYSGISRIALIFSLVAYSLGDVLNARVARYKEKAHIQSYLKKVFVLLAASSVIFLMLLPLAKYVILYTIGPAYLAEEKVLMLLLSASFITILSMPFVALFYSYHLNWYFSVSGVLQLIIVLAGNFLFVPQYGLEAAAWTRLSSRLFLFAFCSLLSLGLYWKKYGSKK